MTYDDPVKTSWEDFGYREQDLAIEALSAFRSQNYSKMFDDYFDREGLKPAFNNMSGYVFLTNENYDVAMMSNDKLEMFFSCPECGYEGSESEIIEDRNRCDHIVEAFNMIEYYPELKPIEAE